MKGLLADVNITGQVRELVRTFYGSEEWSEVWLRCTGRLHVP